jgi:hypothetical protein
MVLADGAGTPLGIPMEKASPAAGKWLEPPLEKGRIGGRRAQRRTPKRLLAARGDASNQVSALLVKRDLEPIMPARSTNRGATPQDGRQRRRDTHRGISARTNAWLQNFRRLVVRYERSAKTCMALVHLAWALTTLKKVLG